MRIASILLILILMPLSGCFGNDDGDGGGGDNGDTPPGNGDPGDDTLGNVSIDVSLGGAYPATITYTPERITVPNNSSVTLSFTNDDQNPIPAHDLVIEGIEGGNTKLLGNGESDTITFVVDTPGEYAFYCSVSGHRENGMEGVFVVE